MAKNPIDEETELRLCFFIAKGLKNAYEYAIITYVLTAFCLKGVNL